MVTESSEPFVVWVTPCKATCPREGLCTFLVRESIDVCIVGVAARSWQVNPQPPGRGSQSCPAVSGVWAPVPSRDVLKLVSALPPFPAPAGGSGQHHSQTNHLHSSH